MTLSRTRLNPKAQRICELLVTLGLPRKEVYRQCNRNDESKGAFWQREAPRLDLWLERAHTAYRQRMINLHPDRGGSVKDAALLNTVWGRVRYLFRKHGVTL